MSVFEEIRRANRVYASGFAKGGLAASPKRKFAVLACMDARLDPAKALGLEEGDAHVIRNAGGRVTDDAVRSLVISEQLLGTEAVVVLHHTECGMLTFTDDQVRARLRPTLGDGVDRIEFLSFADLEQSVRDDVDALLASPLIPDAVAVRGFIYDVHSGSLREVD